MSVSAILLRRAQTVLDRLQNAPRRHEAQSAHLTPIHIMRALGLTPDPWQQQLLHSQPPRALLCCARQTGKSITAAVLATYEALARPPALVLLLSPSLRQSQELFRKCLDCYRALGCPVPPAQESALRLELANGSRIVSLPGKEQTVRGFSGVWLLIVDEAARVEDELYFSTRPMLAVSGGRLILMSTPFGKRGFFFREWTEGAGWDRVLVKATDCPRISPAFLEEERNSLGDWWYRQEYLCEFVENTDQVFGYNYVQKALSADVKPLWS